MDSPVNFVMLEECKTTESAFVGKPGENHLQDEEAHKMHNKSRPSEMFKRNTVYYLHI